MLDFNVLKSLIRNPGSQAGILKGILKDLRSEIANGHSIEKSGRKRTIGRYYH